MTSKQVPDDGWPPEIPQVYQSAITTFTKARLRTGKNQIELVVLAATNQGHLLLFSRGKLKKNGLLPFKDCCMLDIYRSYCHNHVEEYAVASSQDNAVIVDLNKLKVLKEWNQIKKIEVKDYFVKGKPQIVIHFKDSLQPTIVTEDSEWQPATNSPDFDTEMEETPLHNVIEALETQLCNLQQTYCDIENQTLVRSALLNKSLTSLTESVMNHKTSNQTPTYLIPIMSSPDLYEIRKQQQVKVLSSPVWQSVIEETWIVGTLLTNNYEQSMSGIECIFSCSVSCTYQMYYCLIDSSNLSISVKSAGRIYLSTSPFFDGTLPPNQSLAVIVKTPVPNFDHDTEYVRGSLILTYATSDEPMNQMKLGSVSLDFNQFCKRNFEPKISSDLSTTRQNLLSYSSYLEHDEDLVINTGISSVDETFKTSLEVLQAVQFSPFNCYYCHGIFGHVILSTQSLTKHSSSIRIRARSTRQFSWFVQCLKSALPDDATLSKPVKKVTFDLRDSLERRISSAMSLLSSYELNGISEAAMDTSPSSSTSNLSALDKIRTEFLSRQSALMDSNRHTSRHFLVPSDKYQHWQLENNRLG